MSEKNVSTYKCVLNPEYHYKGYRMSDGYSMQVCITCGKIFSLEKAPELTAKEAEIERLKAEIREAHEVVQIRDKSVEAIQHHAEAMAGALERVRRYIGQYSRCKKLHHKRSRPDAKA